MDDWTDWVLCEVTVIEGRKVYMLPIGETNGNVFYFTIPENLDPPEVGDQFRFTPLQQVGKS